MNVDSLRNASNYLDLSPRMADAVGWLQATDLASLPVGEHEISEVVLK